MANIIFIGAGPVGLWTAIQCKLSNPTLDILMLEKYPEYQRKHVVSIDKASLKKAHPDQEFQDLIKSFEGLIPTSQLEEKLKAYALKLGIRIQYENVTSCKQLADKYPHTQYFIGADGAHSVVRKDIFEEKKSQSDLQYVIEMKYEIQGKSRTFSLWSEAYEPLLKANHLVVEHVGKKNEDQPTPITLRVFVDKNTYERMSKATFKNPYHWTPQDKQKMDPKLIQTLEIWLKEREQAFGDKIVPNSQKISALTMSVYQSENVVHIEGNRTWLLVGDAAFGVPYFRSLNNGLLCGSKLAQKLIATIEKGTDNIKSSFLGFKWQKSISPLTSYARYVAELSHYETFMARLKALGLNALRSKMQVARTMLGIGIIGDQAEASIPNRLMMFGLSAIAVGSLIYARKSQQNQPNNQQQPSQEPLIQAEKRVPAKRIKSGRLVGKPA